MALLKFNDVKKMTISQLLDHQGFIDQYTWLYNKCNKSKNGLLHYTQQIGYLKRLMNDNAKIKKATALSVMTALLDLAYHGLSIESIPKAQAYIQPRAHKYKTKDGDVWEDRVVLVISAYGELHLRVRSKVIKYADNPTMVYEGDLFTIEDGKVRHARRFLSEKIEHAFIKITRHDDSVEYKAFSMADILTYRKKSKDPDSIAWTGGVEGQPTRGMIEAKVIRHAFSTYPRLNLGENSVLLTDELDVAENDSAYATVLANIHGDDNGDDSDELPVTPVSNDEDNPLLGEDDLKDQRDRDDEYDPDDDLPVTPTQEEPAPPKPEPVVREVAAQQPKIVTPPPTSQRKPIIF